MANSTSLLAILPGLRLHEELGFRGFCGPSKAPFGHHEGTANAGQIAGADHEPAGLRQQFDRSGVGRRLCRARHAHAVKYLAACFGHSVRLTAEKLCLLIKARAGSWVQLACKGWRIAIGENWRERDYCEENLRYGANASDPAAPLFEIILGALRLLASVLELNP